LQWSEPFSTAETTSNTLFTQN